MPVATVLTIMAPLKAPPTALDLTITVETGRAFVSFVRRNLLSANKILRSALVELSVVLVGDGRMAELHERFMGIPGPTDVLTFPLDVDAHGNVASGEVVVCVPEARRQATERGTSLREEVLLYALHGLLHLCGYDDRTDAAYRAMHRKEDEILGKLGVGPVFHHVARPAEPATRRMTNRTPGAGHRKNTPTRRRKAGGAG